MLHTCFKQFVGFLQGSLDLDATQGPSESTKDFTYSQDTSSPESSITVESPKKPSDPAAKPRKRQVRYVEIILS